MTSPTIKVEDFLCGTDAKIGDLHVEKIIPSMTEKEKLYSTYLCLASWAGFPIILDQISKESPKIHNFLSAFLPSLPKDKLVKSLTETDEESLNYKYILEYAANFYYNSGNFLGFGDTKFIPRISKEKLTELTPPNLQGLLNECIDDMYLLENGKVILGYSPHGVTTYYEPSDISEDEIVVVNKVIVQNNLKLENTKIIRDDNKKRYNVCLPSIEIDTEGKQIGEVTVPNNGANQTLPVYLTKGRYSEILKKVNHWLQLAKENAANETEVKMLDALISSYQTGSGTDHVQYSEYWVKDIDPPVEFYHGFIESYRDPNGTRSEFEGFVACVDPKESRVLHNFVDASNVILPLLPYPHEYERKTFSPPSYNALNILTFVTSGFPIGINIPNYEEIRSEIGFKNVSLTNVINASAISRESLIFLNDEDAEIVIKYFNEADNIGTASHELYGHGSGRLLHKSDVENGQIKDLLNPSRTVTTYYEENQTAEQTFGGIFMAFEECRAETSALYLSFFDEVLDIFEISKDKKYREDLTISGILGMLHAGLKTLLCYSPEAHKWKQAHAAARFAILRACMIWGRGSVSVVKEITPDHQTTFRLVFDRNNMDGVKDAVTKLLVHLNYYKSTNQHEAGKQFFTMLTSIDDFFLEVRTYASNLKRPRYIYTAAKIEHNNDKYSLSSTVPEGETANLLHFLFGALNNIELSLK